MNINLLKNVQYLMSFATEPENNFHKPNSSSSCFKEAEEKSKAI